MPDRSTRAARGSATRGALLAAAVAVVDRDGVAALTTRRVAEQAGLPLGTVHYWFSDKADLLRGVMDALLDDVRAQLAVDDDRPDIDDGLSTVFARFATMPRDRQIALFEITLHALRDPGSVHLASRQYDAYRTGALAHIGGWAELADRSLPGGAAALSTLLVAVIDGLTLAELSSPEDPSHRAALSLFAQLIETALTPALVGKASAES